MTAEAQPHRAANAPGLAIRATCILAMLLVMSTTACAGGSMKGIYSQASVRPVSVERSGDDVVIQFVSPPESMYYVPGVSYEMNDGEMRVVIDRCPIRGECSTMAKRDAPPGEGRTMTVSVPFAGDSIVLLHADGEQRIFP